MSCIIRHQNTNKCCNFRHLSYLNNFLFEGNVDIEVSLVYAKDMKLYLLYVANTSTGTTLDLSGTQHLN